MDVFINRPKTYVLKPILACINPTRVYAIRIIKKLTLGEITCSPAPAAAYMSHITSRAITGKHAHIELAVVCEIPILVPYDGQRFFPHVPLNEIVGV